MDITVGLTRSEGRLLFVPRMFLRLIASVVLSAVVGCAMPGMTVPAMARGVSMQGPVTLETVQPDFFSVDWQRRFPAYVALLEMGEPAAPVFARALLTDDVELRLLGASGLVQLGTLAASALPALSHALNDEHDTVRQSAAWAMAEIGPPSVRFLNEALVRDDAYTQALAAWALGRIGPEAAPAANSLVELLADARPYVRWTAMDTFVEIGAAGIDPLLTALRVHPVPFGRAAAAHLLGHIGVAEERVIDGLLRASDEQRSIVRMNAADALGRLSSSRSTVERLIVLLEDEQAHVADAAFNSLGLALERLLGITPEEIDALGPWVVLEEAIQHPDETTRMAAQPLWERWQRVVRP